MVVRLPHVERCEVSAYRIPTEAGPESDGTLVWNSTTIVVVTVHAGGAAGLGYTYGHHASATLIEDHLAEVVVGRSSADVEEAWSAMRASVRNYGAGGIAASSISAVDSALWDLKARLLDLPLEELMGGVRDRIPAYGSGGFTSFDLEQLSTHLRGYREAGFRMVKIKVGRDPDRDAERLSGGARGARS